MGVLEQIREKYPSLAFLANDPEIGPLLAQAVDPNQGYSPQTFQAKLYQTNWWKSKSQSAREWMILSNTDPGEANRQRKSMQIAAAQKARQLGVGLSWNQLKLLSEGLLQHGQAPDGPEMMEALRGMWDFRSRGKGQIGGVRQQVMNLTKAYFSRPHIQETRGGRKNLDDAALKIATGQDTLEGMQHRLTLDAMRRYPHMKEQLAAGQTVAEIIAPLREMVADEMDYASADQVDVRANPVWNKLFGVRDPKSGKTRLMTEGETLRMVRQQPTWWKTSKGRQADSSMTQTVLNMFGERRSSGMSS